MVSRNSNSLDHRASIPVLLRAYARKLPADIFARTDQRAYALAKISGLKYCEYLNRQYGTDYISVMPTNLYGPNDNYHPYPFTRAPGFDPPFP